MSRRAYFAPLYSLFLSLAACTGTAAGTAVTTGSSFSGCGSPGANTNEHDPGDEPGGIALDLGELGVSPTGAFVIFKSSSSLMVGWPGDDRVQALSLKQPTKLAFSKKRNVVYVVSAADGRVHALDVAADEDLWSAPLGVPSSWLTLLDASADDTRLLVSSDSHLVVLDAQTGAVVAEQSFDTPVVDLQVLPDDERAIVVTFGTWAADAAAPNTEIALIHLADGQWSKFDVPNCAATLAITPDGTKAFLAPSMCNKDPISLIDLTPGQEGWVKNLPGFGPVAIGPSGTTAVAFLDTQTLDTTLFDDPALIPAHGPNDPRYYIMTLDTQSLKYDFTAWGPDYPRYQLTPDGRSLLVDWAFGSTQAGVKIFDTEKHTLRPVFGPALTLDDFVITDDSKHVYASSSGLFDLDVASGMVVGMSTGGAFVQNINISPGGKTLYLRESESSICIYDIAARQCTGYFVSPAASALSN